MQYPLKKIAAIMLAGWLLSACNSLPPHLRYEEPAANYAEIAQLVGSQTEEWLFHSAIRLVAVNERYVNSIDGVKASRITRLSPGPQQLMLEFQAGTEYMGRETLRFNAKAGRSYKIVFTYPLGELEAETEIQTTAQTPLPDSLRASGLENASHSAKRCGAWIEDRETNQRVSEPIEFWVQHVPRLINPIFIGGQ